MSTTDLLRAIARQAYPHVLQIVKTPAPGAQTEITITVPGGQDWRVISLRTSLGTDATVPARNPSLIFDDQTDVFAQVHGNMAIAASLLTVVNFVADMGMGPIPTVNNVACASIPPMVLPSGYRIRTSTANLAATDGYTASVLCVERLDEPPHLSPMTGTAEEEAVHDYLQAIREGEMS